ncbi:MAG: DUF1611 domain-containing protein [Jaaginema sp. PMC 1079.18]|nr:DUF1611 domain-containing protein [Jaaginema sp. PMC 1080.18]MEC4849681.1 DUF1611 domain-containing protein [Jaaginema sp. PMC 1079.18]MEC4866164.1 DUF1611 domain-containing protein [Jaaginema sp. PMC 1078.18]
MHLTPDNRVAILLHQGIREANGKTGLTFLRYSDATIVAAIDEDCSGESISALTGIAKNVPIVASVTEALAYQPDVLVIGIAPSGGALPPTWWQEVKSGVEAGLSVINGLHTPMQGIVESLKEGQWIWDIRQEPLGLQIGKGRARSLSGRRILTVGTDMSVGKMSAGIELYRTAQKRGIKTEMVATGQGGLMLFGRGVPLDAVRVDFAAGAIEKAVLEIGADCPLLWIEGQGSIFHPGSTATLPLLRGSQPTDLILVHRVGQDRIHNCPQVKIPPLGEAIQVYETIASAGGTFGTVKVRGIALNTFALGEREAKDAIAQTQAETQLPCTDVVRFGGDFLLDAILASTS